MRKIMFVSEPMPEGVKAVAIRNDEDTVILTSRLPEEIADILNEERKIT